jgi:hypothetical protein
MTRTTLFSATISVVLSAVMLPSSRADEFADPFANELQTPPLQVPVSVPAPLGSDELNAQPVAGQAQLTPRAALYRQVGETETQTSPMPINPEFYAAPQPAPMQQPGYVKLGAPLYPSPRPNIPIWTGATMITTPALAPHEMLYPHTYRSMHGPYYHRVKGGWIWTPFGIRSHERWELQGTQVEVKYRSHAPAWYKSMWFPPVDAKFVPHQY